MSKDLQPAVQELLSRLEALGNEKLRERYLKSSAGDNAFGVQLGEIRKIAKELKSNHELGLALWATGNMEARLLGILLMKPAKLSRDELDRMVRSLRFVQVADWLNSYVVKNHPEKESLRQQWMTDDDPWAARAGWNLTSERVNRDPEGLDPAALLDRIESEMADASSEAQWTMNNTLAGIGIHFPEHRERAVAIGEKLGIYRDYPVPKGCTSPFAPIWINEIVRRQG